MQLNTLSVGPTYAASAVIQSLAAGIRSVLQYLYNTCQHPRLLFDLFKIIQL